MKLRLSIVACAVAAAGLADLVAAVEPDFASLVTDLSVSVRATGIPLDRDADVVADGFEFATGSPPTELSHRASVAASAGTANVNYQSTSTATVVSATRGSFTTRQDWGFVRGDARFPSGDISGSSVFQYDFKPEVEGVARIAYDRAFRDPFFNFGGGVSISTENDFFSFSGASSGSTELDVHCQSNTVNTPFLRIVQGGFSGSGGIPETSGFADGQYSWDLFDLKLTRSKALEVVRNSENYTITAFPDSPTIRASFHPNNCGNLSDLASALGIIQFGWIQTVEVPPADVLLRVSPDGMDIQELQGPQVDPATYLPDRTLVGRDIDQNGSLDLDEVQRVDLPGIDFSGPAPDSLPFYHNIDESYFSDKVVFFEDSPAMPPAFIQPGESLKFRTELVGIDAELDPVPLGFAFTWESNATIFGGGGVYLRSDGRPFFDEESGGVFNIEFHVTEVPEPNACHLLLVLCALAASISRRAC